MSGVKFTPGPWHVIPLSIANIENEDGSVQVAMASQVASNDRETNHAIRRANARLIAAAPTMYEALEELVRINEEWNVAVQKIIGRPPAGVWSEQYLDKAKAALRKARGE